MNTIARHTFLVGALSATLAPAGVHAQAIPSPTPEQATPVPADAAPLRLRVNAGAAGEAVGTDFIGLSYETKALYWGELKNDPTFVALLRGLGSGNLRVGGNQVEFGIWSDDGHPAFVDSRDYPIGPTDAQALAALAEAADWNVICGVSMAHSDPQRAAAQAAGWQRALGRRLVGLEIGNEPDVFPRNHLFGDGYDYARFIADWRRFADAIEQRGLGALLTGPATARNTYGWTIPFAHDARGRISLLTHHYYRNHGNPGNSIAWLLSRDPTWPKQLADLVAAAKADGIGFRLAETNTVSGGGLSGGAAEINDTFASALWAVRHMVQLLNAGAVGVNFHGGGPALYTPIHWDDTTGYSPRPIYFAIQAASALLPGRVLPTTLDGEAEAIDAVAVARSDGALALLIGNTGAAPRTVTIDAGRPVTNATVRHLAGEALDSKALTTLDPPAQLSVTGPAVSLPLAGTSASLVVLQ
ncbi:MAG TPA: hypothetical protein VME66_13665 [Candidatus Acidoferrales bacterium]|nr:hypothetical protein [Candidatus Acidoferrales bacterium]